MSRERPFAQAPEQLARSIDPIDDHATVVQPAIDDQVVPTAVRVEDRAAGKELRSPVTPPHNELVAEARALR